MRTTILFFCLLLTVLSCKNDKPVESSVDYKEDNLEVTTSVYPENITKIMDAHGGLEAWKNVNTLVFGMEKPNGMEMTTTDLKTRKSLIETNTYNLGFDGQSVWLKENDEPYKGYDPAFYYNLMFYFYAMPFVLADDGITYTDADPLVFEGKSYPGIKISYGEGIGESPDDEYILYYNPETYQMEWLGYTVTYFSKEKSKKISFIKYNSWGKLAGLKLPKTIQWYKSEGMTVSEMRNEVKFTNTSASTVANKDEFYVMPEGGKLVE